MKNLNLSLIALLFSSLLMGCGMKGPLYRETSSTPNAEQVQKKQVTNTQENSNLAETEETTL